MTTCATCQHSRPVTVGNTERRFCVERRDFVDQNDRCCKHDERKEKL